MLRIAIGSLLMALFLSSVVACAIDDGLNLNVDGSLFFMASVGFLFLCLPGLSLCVSGFRARARDRSPALPVEVARTPEVAYAALWRRTLAGLVDLVRLLPMGAVLCIGTIGLFATLTGDPQAWSEEQQTGLTVAALLTPMAGWVLVLARQEGSEMQATIGKLVFGFGVATGTGGRVSFARAANRRVLALILWPFATLIPVARKRQSLHDVVAGCVMPRLDQEAEARRQAYLAHWGNQFFPVALPMLIGVMTIPVGVGVVIVVVWAGRYLHFRREAKRLLREIRGCRGGR